MSGAVSPVTGRPYGLAAVCRAWRVSRATVYRCRAAPRLEPPRRPGPVGPMPDTGLLDAIRAVLADNPFHGEGHRKVWARLRMRGVRTSRRRVLRLMRAHDLLAPSRVGSPRGPRSHDGTIIPATIDTMWGTDLTTTITGEGQAAVFIAVDHFSAECVGIHAARQATRFEALEPIRQGVRQHFGGFAKDIARALSVRHDHGSQYMSDAFQGELRFLGIESSPAFVRAPEGNGCAERFIRTLKENLLWVRTFETVEELRFALLKFRETYNATWLIERHAFQTPAAVRHQHLQPAALAAQAPARCLINRGRHIRLRHHARVQGFGGLLIGVVELRKQMPDRQAEASPAGVLWPERRRPAPGLTSRGSRHSLRCCGLMEVGVVASADRRRLSPALRE